MKIGLILKKIALTRLYSTDELLDAIAKRDALLQENKRLKQLCDIQQDAIRAFTGRIQPYKKQ